MKDKTVLIIDGQGGGLGKTIIERMRREGWGFPIHAVGTNTQATAAMLKAGADAAATGENAVKVNAQRAHVIIGSMGIIAANAMMGEITPDMALAISSCEAIKLLLPFNRCNVVVIGVSNQPLSEQLDELMQQLRRILGSKEMELSE